MRELSVVPYESDAELPEASVPCAVVPRARPGKAQQKRRVMLVQTQAENAGAQEITRLLGAALTARGYEVYNIFFFRKSDSFDEPPNTFYCSPKRPGNPLALLQMLWRLGRHISKIKPDAVLTFQHFGNVIGGGVSRLTSSAPIIANQVSSRLSMNWLVRTADIVMGSLGVFKVITVNSRDMEREYSRYPADYRSRMVHVAHGFDDKSLDIPQATARQLFNLPVGAVMLGSVGRLHPNKCLDAAIGLLTDEPKWHLALAGQGPDEGRLKRLADELQVSDRMHFIGEISPGHVGEFLASLDVFVFPSRAETFGLAAVEAASSGIPTVVRDLPVLQEVLSIDGKPAALFVDASDNEKLSAAVSRILNDKNLRDELRRAGKGLASRYSVEAMVGEYVRVLDETIPAVGSQP
jgi:glycosyltransferase involved in cell wall biosynthesis